MSRFVRALGAAAVLGFVIAVAGCDQGTGSAGPTGPRSSPPSATHDAGPGLTIGPPASPTPDDATLTVIDPALLEFLPETVGGVEVVEAPDEAALALSDPTISEIATALDVGLAVDQAGGNLVTAHVVKVREGAFGDEAFRQWRDSFDEGACAAAGGVEGRLETTIRDRTVFVTSCVAELRTYHAWIEAEGLLVSASSVGSGRFGELLMAGLRVE